MRKLKDFYRGPFALAFLILWIYLFAVFAMQTIAANSGYSIPFELAAAFASFVLTYLIFYFGGAADLVFHFPDEKWDKKSMHFLLAAAFAGTLCIYSGCLFCNYPGGFSADSEYQYFQAYTGLYTNWHPALHTLLFFTPIVKLTDTGYPLIVFLQILYFSMAISYMVSVLARNGMKLPFILLFCAAVWTNPYLAINLMYPYKDLALTIFTVVLIGQYIQIVCTKGQWLQKKWNLAAFAGVSVLCMYMRHNAILLVAPIVVFAMVYVRRKKRLVLGLIAVIAAMVFSVQGIYAVLDVEEPDKRILETVGLPVTIWCSVMQKTPEALPEDTRAVMYQIATKDTYENDYIDGNFNSVKWSGTDNEVIDAMSYGQVLKYTVQCFVYSPKAALEGFAKLTKLVWGIDEQESSFHVRINTDYERTSLHTRFARYFNQYLGFFEGSAFLKTLCGSYGIQMIVLLAVGMVLLAKNRLSILHAVPVLCYNYGTMLLLSGPDYRFFVYNIPIFIPVLFLMGRDRTEIPICGGKNKRK